jgi:citrate lyase beta subunit
MKTPDGVLVRRTFFEVPTMDERKWAKIPTIPADVFFADIEDSVAPDLKEKARAKVIDLVKDPSVFGDREFICRPNNIATAWGPEDIEALAEANAPFVLYPKVRTVEEIQEVEAIFDRHDVAPELMLIIETPQAVLNLEAIASSRRVTALMFGPGDLAFETGVSLLDGEEPFREGFLYARSKAVMVARALNLEIVDGAVFLANAKDMERTRRGAEFARLMGFTGMGCFYPPQVPIINEVMTPSLDEIAQARGIVEGYEHARATGSAAVSVGDRAITVHEYRIAQRIVRLAEVLDLA